MKEIEIRDLQLEDLYNETFYTTLRALYEVKLREEVAQDIFYYKQHCGSRTLVAVSGDTIIATGSIYIDVTFGGEGDKVAYLEDIAVSVNYQRMGIGTLIVNKLINLAEGAGCYKTILCCSPANVAFYENLGFHKHEYCMRRDNVI